jgi:hypothetical protein
MVDAANHTIFKNAPRDVTTRRHGELTVAASLVKLVQFTPLQPKSTVVGQPES